ncbi:alpha/beta hydrolase [Streptomyces sp. AcE210]|uniref:alpha/beta fold hydrolase n=1 Tax=Streptomyces sp. AcE210 TaxID=2292703 RepID=UPI000E306E53|nr:alpha/beta hydrolase [Streptomyces sp. AcE210]RFC78531.1 alpha/beta hydrolase [Streptomyces sp. AcE210]
MTVRMKSPAWKLGQQVRVSGGEVAADVFGQGPPVMLVHGTPASSYLWRDVVSLLAHEHTVYVWDLLGFGNSRLAPGLQPSIARQARTLAELAEHWGLDSPSLVGHDIGGGVVARAHLMEQLPVRRLAFVDAAILGPWNTPFTEHQQRHADAYRTMPADVFGELISARFRTATHRPMSAETANAYLAPWAGQDGQQRWMDQVTAVSFEDTREVMERLGEITAPTLVLWGDQDQWIDPAIGTRIAAAIPGATRATVPGAGHFAAEDNPHDTAQALMRFFA